MLLKAAPGFASATRAPAAPLDYAAARFGSVDEIYRSEMGRDILVEPTLLFADAAENGATSAAAQDR